MIKIQNRKIFVIPGIIIILITAIVVYIMIPRGKPLIIQNKEFLFENLQDGDIICRLGDRLWSQVFRDTSNTDKRFSHMGIIRINYEKITVIHAEGTTELGRDFVKEQDLEDFLKIARSIGIYRKNNIEGSLISDKALEYLGLPFDWSFDIQDESKIYCTELLYVILKQLMPEIELKTSYIKELGKEIIPLDAISHSEYFTEIYFIDYAEGNLRP